MCSSGPCERQFNLGREERFNKSARAIIHRNCLLPVLSEGSHEIPCYLFRMFCVCRLTVAAMLRTRRERFHPRRPPLIQGRQVRMNRNRAGTHMIEHLVDGLADHMRLAAASRAGGTIAEPQVI